MAVALGRIYNVIRQEQLQGTLESLFLTPTSHATIQLGSVVYDLAYVPIRTVLFFVMVTVFFPASFYWSGLMPTVAILVAYIPFVWGIGVMAAAWTLTFRRGTAMIGIFTTIATLGAGTYFPTDVFPTWLQAIVQYLPLTVVLQGFARRAARRRRVGRRAPDDRVPDPVRGRVDARWPVGVPRRDPPRATQRDLGHLLTRPTRGTDGRRHRRSAASRARRTVS